MFETDDIKKQMEDRSRIQEVFMIVAVVIICVLIAIPVALIIWMKNIL